MKKLDDLDIYIRTQIKNEIATERINYVSVQRAAIENGLSEKMSQKPTLKDIKNEFNPIIEKIFSVFSVCCSNLYMQSSIISCA